jgi:CBS-domain-containing membrane protein
MSNRADVPAVNAKRILARKNDFTDLCVYHALHESILPRIADFGAEDNAERQKIGFYQQRYDALLKELIEAGDWYDYDADAVLTSDEFSQGFVNPRRIR